MSLVADAPAHALVALKKASRDRIWWLLVAAGPLTWLLLLAVGMRGLPAPPPVSALLYGVLLYPLLEEIVFRGLMQPMLLERAAMQVRAGPVSRANVITSLAFAASHLISQSPLQAASILLPSLVFGYVYERFKHVLPCIVLHAFYNAGFLSLFVY